jgi:N-acetylglucosaminyl-diphospho-decaprenol L-rhamnosyltransferase
MQRYLVYDRAAVTRLSAVVVTFNSREAVTASLPPLLRELSADDEVVVVDNASSDGTAESVRALAPAATVIENHTNEGFAAACNRGVEAASGELVVLLNPDAAVAPGFGEAIRRPLAGDRGWSAWMGLVTCEGGRSINTSGGVLHFTGIAWAGEAGERIERAPAEPREVAFASGACLALTRTDWLAAGGLPAQFFLYHEDVDLSLRVRLRGGKIGIEPAARVDHDYEFAKGAAKWRFLERNRWSVIVRVYPGALIVALLPALLATELALLAVSASNGWARQKLLATLDILRALPRLLRERREIQAKRRITACDFAAWLTPELSSPFLGPLARSRVLGRALRLYWGAVLVLLRCASARR